MAEVFAMPSLGSTMEEGTILAWRKQEGEPIKAGETLLEVETDKASMEVEAPRDCVLRKIVAAVGSIVPVRETIAILGTADEPIDHLLGGASPAEQPVASSAAPVAPIAQAPSNSQVAAPSAPAQAETSVSPRARRLADANGVSLAQMAGIGTGPQGRVIESDVKQLLAARAAAPVQQPDRTGGPVRATPMAARLAGDLGVDLEGLASGLPGSRVRTEDVRRQAEAGREAEPAAVRRIPFAGLRRKIADNVSKSRFSAPHVTLTLEVDMTEASDLRQRLLPEVEKAYGVRLSFNDMLVKACARALDDHPMLNASLIGDEIIVSEAKNIGIAVALKEGLVVPVLQNAGRKTLGQIAAEAKPLIERSRTGKFSPDDLAGGTFSITNLGGFGIDVFDPIINPPQAAILGVGRIADKPVVVAKEIVIRSMMNLCLSFDHRIVDGAPAAQFLQRLKEILESPLLLLI